MSKTKSVVPAWLLSVPIGLGVACGDGGPNQPEPGPDAVATYRVTFDATWSLPTHPVSFPLSAHFSGLIGGTHDATLVLWEVGGLASPGIKDMAELGAKTALTSEVEAAVQSGSAWSVLSGGGISPSPSSVELTFDIHMDYARVSLVSMIAPSPDWFVGVSRLELRQNGQWRDVVTVDLFPYDAGTDSGLNYMSADSVTSPAAPISALTDVPFDMGVPLGTFTFVRQ